MTLRLEDYDCLDQVAGRPYAMFIRAGNDGSGAISSIQRILKGLALKQVQAPLLMSGDFDESKLIECEDLGMTMAAGLEAGVY